MAMEHARDCGRTAAEAANAGNWVLVGDVSEDFTKWFKTQPASSREALQAQYEDTYRATRQLTLD